MDYYHNKLSRAASTVVHFYILFLLQLKYYESDLDFRQNASLFSSLPIARMTAYYVIISFTAGVDK